MIKQIKKKAFDFECNLQRWAWNLGLRLCKGGFHSLADMIYRVATWTWVKDYQPFSCCPAIYNGGFYVLEYELIFHNRFEFDRLMFRFFAKLNQNKKFKTEIVYGHGLYTTADNGFFSIHCKDGFRDFSQSSNFRIKTDNPEKLKELFWETYKEKATWWPDNTIYL